MAVLLAIVLTSFTDWFFVGALFHEKYRAHSEVWRRPRGGPNDAIFIKIHPLTTVAHAAGWLVRLLVAAACTSAVLS